MGARENVWACDDAEGRVLLFRVADGKPVAIDLVDWFAILEELGAQPGELVKVRLEKPAAVFG
jgi:hypothetical protein